MTRIGETSVATKNTRLLLVSIANQSGNSRDNEPVWLNLLRSIRTKLSSEKSTNSSSKNNILDSEIEESNKSTDRENVNVNVILKKF